MSAEWPWIPRLTARGTLRTAMAHSALRRMLQSWNKLCFTGGRMEVRLWLPGRGIQGDPDSTGFWPGIWTLGNLARAGYGGSSFGTWPYTYDTCDEAIKQNYTVSLAPGQRINRCVADPGPGLHPHQGRGAFPASKLRPLPHEAFTQGSAALSDMLPPLVCAGAPEIDVLEAGIGTASQSYQLAPFSRDWDLDMEHVYAPARCLPTAHSRKCPARMLVHCAARPPP